MPVKLKITQFGKGPTLKLVVVITSQSSDDKQSVISDIFQIAGFAVVRLRLVTEKSVHVVSMSTIKHTSVRDPAIRMIVTCNELKYSKKWACSEKWTDWIDMGQATADKIYESSSSYTHVTVYLLTLEISISVQKICTPAFQKLYEDEDMTDFHLSTSEGSVAVHRAVLAVHSDVFKTMFTGEWKETKENLIEIKGSTLQTVQHLKDFMYLGTLPKTGLRPLLALAALYSVRDLIKECSWKLAETVSPLDMFSLHKFACENNIPELTYALT